MNFRKISFAIILIIVLIALVLSQEQYQLSELQDPNFNWNNLDVNKIDFNDPTIVNQVWDNWNKIPQFRQQELLRTPQMQDRIRSDIGLTSFSGCEAAGASCSYDKSAKKLTNGHITISTDGLKNTKVTALPEGGFRIEGKSTVPISIGGISQDVKTEGTIEIKDDKSITTKTHETKIVLANGREIKGEFNIDPNGRIIIGEDIVTFDDHKNGIHILATDTSISFREDLYNNDKINGKNAIYIDENGNILATGKRITTKEGSTTFSPYSIYIGKDMTNYGFELEIDEGNNGLSHKPGTITELSAVNDFDKVIRIEFNGQTYNIYSGYLLVHNKQEEYANVNDAYVEVVERIKQILNKKIGSAFGSNKEILDARVEPIVNELHKEETPIVVAREDLEYCEKYGCRNTDCKFQSNMRICFGCPGREEVFYCR